MHLNQKNRREHGEEPDSGSSPCSPWFIPLIGVTLIWLLVTAAPGQSVNRGEMAGRVRDAAGAVIGQATVTLLNARQSVIASTQTDAQGRFSFREVPSGSYEVLVVNRGFEPTRAAVLVPSPEAANVILTLGATGVAEQITITADIGLVQPADSSAQQVNVIDERKIEQRAFSVLAQVAQEEVGVQLQRTSPTIGAIFVRGLTGAKVSVFVDGIRYSTAAMRGGINTFFNLNDPTNLRAVEILRGPNSAQFGSDSLGGGISLISRAPLFSATDRAEVHGRVSTHFNSADLSYGGHTLATFATRDLGVLVNLAARRANTIRMGNGIDTHAAVTRFLGLPSDLFGERATDTAFTQYGGLLRLTLALAPTRQLNFHYQRAQQDGGKRYDQTLGGDGNLIADLRNLMLDFCYFRYDQQQAGWFDTLSASYSYNGQREERVNQGGNGNPRGAITHQYERTVSNGAQFQATKLWGERNALSIGGDFYYDRVRAPAYTLNPVTGVATLSRPRVPDRTRYLSGGVYLQDVWTAIPERLRLTGALRYNAAAYRSRASNSPLAQGRPLWPDDSLKVESVAPRFGAVLTLLSGLSLSGQVSRGFRAPHITDLGTLGLTGNGFEAAAADLEGFGATIGTTADRNAVSTGLPVRRLVPETSWSYEGGLHLRRSSFDLEVVGFVNDLSDNIVVQSLILPPGAVGLMLGDQTITTQSPNGVVFVPASTNPVLVRANYGDARISGVEQKFDWRISHNWSVGNTYTYIHSEDRRTGLPPNIEGGTPAPQGWFHLRYETGGGRFWIEPYLYAAGRQERLSSLDLEDRRTGAMRSRDSIRNFFINGATARGLVAPGPDGRFGTADDVLKPTGEVVAQVQDRVLGVGVQSAPLSRALPGFLAVNLRGGFRLGERHDFMVDLENLNDKNYRGISWGLDGPGRSLGFRYIYRF